MDFTTCQICVEKLMLIFHFLIKRNAAVEIVFKNITKDSVKEYEDVFGVSFGKDKAKSSQLENKFESSVPGWDYAGVVGYDRATSKAISCFGIHPVEANYKGEDILVAQAQDLAVSPEYRKKGLFRSMHDELIRVCGSGGIHMYFAWPNVNSYPGFVKFGWLHEIECEEWNKEVRMPFFLKLFDTYFIQP